MRPDKSILSEPANNIESSAAVRKRVIKARTLQLARAGKPNALLDNAELSSYCPIAGEQLALLEIAAEQLFLSPRACHRILKVSRTIADLDQMENIATEHIAEAIAFRRLQISQIGT